MHAPLTFFATTYPPFFARNPVLWRSPVWAVCSRRRLHNQRGSLFLLPFNLPFFYSQYGQRAVPLSRSAAQK